MPRFSGYDQISSGPDVEIHAASASALGRHTSRPPRRGLVVVAGLAVGLIFSGLVFSMPKQQASEPTLEGGSEDMEASSGFYPNDANRLDKTNFDPLGRVQLFNFDTSKPFASFLPAVSGEYGVPMWAFYVNRGQGISTFGTENKDKPIMEFNSANKAYEYVDAEGFRTFIGGKRGADEFFFEPFAAKNRDTGHSAKRDMFIGMNELEIQEVDLNTQIQTNVLYFTVPNEVFPALVRRVSITNLNSESDVTLEVLDGQAKLEPSGADDWHLKNMGRTLEAWMNVYNMDETGNTKPFFKLSASLADTAEVTAIVEGHWAIGYVESPETMQDDGEAYHALPFIVDPNVIFDQDTSLRTPVKLQYASVNDLLAAKQVMTSKTPCAFTGTTRSLAPGETLTLNLIFGRSPSLKTFQEIVADKVRKVNYVVDKRREATELLYRLTDKVAMSSASPVFDAYVRQMYLDNFLRGGYPVVLGDAEQDPKIFHTFSRIHGDLERDYNYFQIDACYYSMGPGAFRDVNQNRRCDTMQEPKVGAFNVKMFLSFVQADGYNPLTVESAYFYLPDAMGNTTSASALAIAAESASNEKDQEWIVKVLSWPAFRPGDVFIALDQKGVKLDLTTKEKFLNRVASAALLAPNAQFNQNGFWADHWTYHQDLVDSFLTVYPDKARDMLYGAGGEVPFYMSPVTCQPRDKKYVLVPESGPRQYDFIYDDADKAQAIQDNAKAGPVADQPWQRSIDGQVFTVTAMAKLFMLAVNKFAIMDPYGMGVEYEGGKPGWNDAMNGLPGLFGSGMPEAFEAQRIFKFIRRMSQQFSDEELTLPREMADLVQLIDREMDELASGDQDDFTYWDDVHSGLEAYRSTTRVYFSGDTIAVDAGVLKAFVDKAIKKMEDGASRALDLNGGVTPTYWIFDVTDYEELDAKDDMQRSYIRVKEFKPRAVPLFLEGPTRQLKVLENLEDRQAVYRMVKKTALYDSDLKMYTISASLESMSFEIGRMMAFVPGWLENQSVWLHMSYKYYLELLRGGLYAEFFQEIQTGLVAFMDPEVYGRSPLECASFIASSAHPDTSIHGQGYLARLSGSTAEFLSMWNLMMMGHEPFVLDSEGDLSLQLRPLIPGWLFTQAGQLSFTLLGKVITTYHNPDFYDTWDPRLRITSSVVVDSSGIAQVIQGQSISHTFAVEARRGTLKSIDIFFSAS